MPRYKDETSQMAMTIDKARRLLVAIDMDLMEDNPDEKNIQRLAALAVGELIATFECQNAGLGIATGIIIERMQSKIGA